MSNLSYDALAVGGLKDILQQVSSACNELDINYFIVGAVARNIWYASHGENVSGTKDVDFGIYVPTDLKYNQLRQILIEKYGYTASSQNAFCLITSNDQQVDLLPFGAIENQEQIRIQGKGLTSLHFEGFKESYEMGTTKAIIGEEEYIVCTVPSVVILKLIAFDDRPDRRIKDIKDINAICKNYADIEDEFIWSEHFDLYENDREHREVAMIVLGREIHKIVAKNQRLQSRIIQIIDNAIHQENSITVHMIDDVETETIEMKINILKHIKQGIVGKSNRNP